MPVNRVFIDRMLFKSALTIENYWSFILVTHQNESFVDVIHN